MTVGPETRRNMVAGGREKFVGPGRTQFADPAVAVKTNKRKFPILALPFLHKHR